MDGKDVMPSAMRVAIRPVVEDDVPLLEQALGRGFPHKHRARLALQAAGYGVYLIAWHGDAPVGHVLIEWAGACDEPMASRLHGWPVISDVYVVAELCSRGIGSRLLDAVEQEARALQRWGVTINEKHAV